jgi:hypothetical protein
MPTVHIPLLLKFGEKEHIEKLLNEGTIFMHRLGHYVELEKDELQKELKRADRYEGLYARYRPESVKIIVDGKEIEGLAEFVDIRLNEIMDKYVYCMAAIKIERIYDYKAGKIPKLIPEELEKFGDHCTVIFATGEFVKRFRETFDVEQLDFVSYVDLKNTEGRIGPFKKDLAFQNQLEFRILVKNHTNSKSPMIGQIGSLEGLAFNMETKSLEEGLTRKIVVKLKDKEGKDIEMSFLDFLIWRYENLDL